MAPGSGPYGALVEARGLGGSHHRILAEVPDGARVLDVGCATGYVAARLSARGCSVVGFERDPDAADEARQHCAEVIVGDIESHEDRARLPRGFDFVLFGDVLEHLVDPWETLAFAKALLRPGGIVLASVPNVAAWPVRLGLLGGSFEYRDFGLLDRTHLRFFTRASAHELARRAGFEIDGERFVHIERPAGPIRRALPLLTSVLDRALARILPGLFAQQFVLRLRPAGMPPPMGR
jgi:2-polyprenyl-3-methyl-5-hydroxy-6-metoxy-1,4-benzoquinol methylase